MYNIFVPELLLHHKVMSGIATNDEAFEWADMMKKFEKEWRLKNRVKYKQQKKRHVT